MSWLVTVVPLLLGMVIIFVPGLMVACSVKLRGLDAVGLAPALSIAMIAISAIIAPMVGVSWSLWVPFVFAVLIAVLGFVMSLISERVAGRRRAAQLSRQKAAEGSVSVEPASAVVPSRWFSKEQGLYYISFAIGALLLARNIKNSVGRPEWISQTFDNNFHLNAIRYIAETGSASSLTVGGLSVGDQPVEFYPAAWHALVSLIFMNTDVSIPVATNVVVLLTGAVIWPLGVVMMMRNIARLNAPTIVSVGALSAAFSAFPVLLIQFGVLYANLLGISLIPIGIAIIAQMFRVNSLQQLTTVQSVYLGLFVALGIAIAHPNAMMSLLVMVAPIFAFRALLQIWSGFRGKTSWGIVFLQVMGIGAIFWLIYYLWGVIRPPQAAGEMWGPAISQGQAYGEVALNATMGSFPQWMVTTLLIIGIFAVVTQQRHRLWLIATWGVVAFYYTAARSLPWEDGRYDVVGVWYHDSFRLAALVPLATIPLSVWGVQWLSEKIINVVTAHSLNSTQVKNKKYSPLNHRSITVVLSVISILTVSYFGQTSKSLEEQVEETFWSYAPSPESSLLTPDEIDVLEVLDNYIPVEDKILVQPFKGGAMAYAFSGREVSAPHTIYTPTKDAAYLEKNLSRAFQDPKVCEIVEKENYYYYLSFSGREVHGGDHSSRYSGFVNVENTGVVTEVYREGDAGLYKITACN